MGRLLRILLRESFHLHLFVPLVVFLLMETAAGMVSRHINSPSTFLSYFFSIDRVWGFCLVYMTYVAIVLLLVRRKAAIHVTNIAALEDILPNAISYFAISPTPLKEWFETGSQVYLAKIVARSFTSPSFYHERVLVFFTRAELESVHATYLDEHYAKSFKTWHQCFNIRLGFLRPGEIFHILRSLDITTQRALGCYPTWVGWLPDRCLKLFPFWWRWRIRSLAFALVEYEAGTNVWCFFRRAVIGLILALLKIRMRCDHTRNS